MDTTCNSFIAYFYIKYKLNEIDIQLGVDVKRNRATGNLYNTLSYNIR